VGRGPVWTVHRKQRFLAVIKNPTAIFVGRTVRTVTEQTGLKCRALLKFAYFCRFRDADKRIEIRRRKAERNKGGDGEKHLITSAYLDYLARAIFYIYIRNTAEPTDKNAAPYAKKAAILILKMEELLTEVTELWDGHQVGTLSLTELRKNMKREQHTTSSSKTFFFTIYYNTVALEHSDRFKSYNYVKQNWTGSGE
jgi:hypothetical protein